MAHLFYLGKLSFQFQTIHGEECKCVFKSYCHHTMQGDTCPTEWYISNSHSAISRVCLTSSDWLTVDFWIHGSVAADTSYSERLLFLGLPLCNVSAATGQCIQKSTFNQAEFVYHTRKFAEWPLDMYPSAGHSIAFYSVVIKTMIIAVWLAYWSKDGSSFHQGVQLIGGWLKFI